ncbi:MAG: hypothetical protein JOZ96_19245 [Acidobacteria bacterium]|nr:hypothetical protein [Acidobacteriota bacterium]MBV9927161.1 hypothetical protein [Acidobacteriota bacterium]
MSHRGTTRKLAAALILLSIMAPASAAQEQKDKDKKKELPKGTPVIWREPADVSALDLLAGPGGEEMRPAAPFAFVGEEKGGFSKKYRVRDAKGRVWVAKVGVEAQPETAVTRLVWAAGYIPEVTYLAPCAKIEGAPDPGKDFERCQDGGLSNVRFEARPEDTKRHGEWRWTDNPFSGRRELQGLKIMMALFENWDLKDDNNRILVVSREGGTELHYVVSDLGATVGKTGGVGGLMARVRQIKGTRNNPEDFAQDKFIEGVESGRVRFSFEGKNKGLMRDITVADAQWLAGILSRLSDKQIADAFRAANYNDDEVRLLTSAVRARIGQLAAVK